jgi:nonsense-mediated mRNA decay protein 3
MGLHENDEMKPRKQDADREAIDYEQFLQDLEQDPELRQGANLYRDEQAKKAAADSEMDTDDDEDDEGLQIPMDQLIDEMEEMGMRDD